MMNKEQTNYIPHIQLQYVYDLMLEFLNVVDKNNTGIKSDFLELRNLFAFSKTSKSAKELEKSNQKITDMFGKISNQNKTNDIIKAFTLYHMLLNIIEERCTQTDTNRLHIAYDELLKEGYKKQDVLKILEELEFYPVFTAHPTESRRRTFLEAHHDISLCLKDIFSDNTKGIKSSQAKERILYRLRLLWDTHLVRNEKIEVLFELDNLLYIIESSVVGTSAKVLKEVESILGKEIQKSQIRLGSWVGGDRDGNPYVNNELMTQVARTQHKSIIKLYIAQIDKLIRELSISSDFINISQRFKDNVEKESVELNQTHSKLFKNEPFRAKLYLIKKKLQNRLIAVNTLQEIDFTYKNVDELLEDIDMMIESLDSLSSSHLLDFKRLVKLGGFHLMKLDFREHRDSFCLALGEILCLLGFCDSDYIKFDEDKKMEILNLALNSGHINLNTIAAKLSNPSKNIVEAFLRILWAQKNISQDIIKSVIISMSTHASDILAVLWFAKQSGLWKQGECSNIAISPLFETIEDLENAGKIISTLKNNPHYNAYLKDCQNVQEIMIGYSDSSKDGGIFTSNFSLYQAISNLMLLQDKLGIQFRLFHGRGGSVSRGGGRLEQALLASAPHSVDGYLKTTEQGEMISSKYLDRQISTHNLSSALGAMLKKSVYDKYGQDDSKIDDIRLDLLKDISDTSFATYRNLVYETPGFIDYFRSATPISFIQRLNLGSRPSKRTNTTRVEDLRAIPWVFAWTQNRCIIPAWYGVGSGLANVDKSMLKDMYDSSLFLKGTIDNIAQAFLKVDLQIGALYNRFVEDRETRERIWDMIKKEYDKTLEMLLFVRGESTLLDSEGSLMEMILIRTPYLSALNLLQIELIKRYNTCEESKKAEIMEQIHSTIVGIAQGIRNTG